MQSWSSNEVRSSSFTGQSQLQWLQGHAIETFKVNGGGVIFPGWAGWCLLCEYSGQGGATLEWMEKPQRFSARYGARHPWLVSWPRAGLYLIWRGLVAGIRPVLFLALLGASGLCALLAARDLPRPAPPPLSISEQMELALSEAAPDGLDRHTWWVSELNTGLQSSRASMPDIEGVAAMASAYTAFRGTETLGLELLAHRRASRLVEAQLRAIPAWQREQRLRQAISNQVEQGRLRGLSPPELVFAPEVLHARLDRSRRLYGSTLEAAETWFVDPGGRVLALDALPGLSGEQVRLYDDLRSLVVRFCAVALEAQQQVGQCRIGFLPKPTADPVLAGLSLAVAGADEEVLAGARLIKAAWAAGRLDVDLAQRLAFGADARLGEAATLASATPLMVEAGEVWTQPARYREAARSATREAARAAGINQVWRHDVFENVTRLRRQVGALTALRLLNTVRTAEDIEQLVTLAESSGQQLLALHLMTGADLLDRVDVAQPRPARLSYSYSRPGEWPRDVQQFAGFALAAFLGALFILLISLYEGFKRKQGKRIGGLERLDAVMSRLILGRNP